VEAVVTAAFADLGGFFLQDPLGDGDPRTSEGIFVFAGPRTNEWPVHRGERVRLAATVSEYYGQTQLTRPEWLSRCGAQDLAPALLQPELLDDVTLEAHEGMFVRFDVPLTIVSSRQLGRFGEMLLGTQGRRYWQTTDPDAAPSASPAALLVLDDGSDRTDPRPLPHMASPELSARTSPRLGDEVDALEGVLAFAYGSYRIHPTAAAHIVARNPRPPAPTREGELRVAAMNVENYFLTLGSRGASTPAQLERQRRGLVAALRGLDADILALTEVENDGGAAVEDLCRALNADRAGDPYVVVPTGPLGSDAIRGALLYRPARVTPRGAPLVSYASTHLRPPLAQTFRWGDRHLTVATVHFKSRSCSGATGLDVDPGDGSGCFQARRAAEAESLVQFLERAQRRAGDSALVLVGDLNTYPGERPALRLVASGLVDLLARPLGSPAPAPPYSYVFQGTAGLLDHVLATPAVSASTRRAGVWHINADEPPVFHALATDAEPVDPLASPPFRSSDHDPVFLDLSWPAQGECSQRPRPQP
jgi:predicted extracellular nuclease